MRKILRSQSGAAAVEFAIVLPFLAFLLIGLVEVGRYMYFALNAAHAAEAGAQYAALSEANAMNQNSISAAVQADSPNVTWSEIVSHPVCYQGNLTVTCTSGTPAPNSIEYVQVTVKGQFKSLLSYPGIPGTDNTAGLPVSASTMIRVLGQ